MLDFTESHLRATVEAYDPAKHEAPIVIGHPKDNLPAYGWVKSLSYADGGSMEADPHQVNAEFAEMVNRGAFKKVSASFYTPGSPQNPVPGVYYLRHVGFLGAQPPAVKGLRAPEFSENEEGVIEFADYDDVVNASLWRRLRDWLIGEKGLEVADNIIPDYQVNALETAAQQESNDTGGTPAPAFSETNPNEGDKMSAEDKVRLAALEKENAEMRAREAAFAEVDKKRKADSRHAANASFAEGLVKEGKLLPGHKDMAVAMLDFTEGQEQVVEFGEGDAKKPLAEGFRAFLQAQPKQVEFAEMGHDKGGKGGAVEFAAPAGYQVDQGRLEVHQKALSYQEVHKVDYVTAVKAVS